MKWNLFDGSKDNKQRLLKTSMLFCSLFVLGLHRQIFDKTIHQILEPNAIDTLEIRRIQFCGHIYGGAIAFLCLWALSLQAQAVQLPFFTLGILTQFSLPLALEMVKPLAIFNGIGNGGTFICALVWMQQLWDVHSGPIFLLVLAFENLGTLFGQILIQSKPSIQNTYNFLLIIAIHVMFALVYSFGVCPNNPKQPPAPNRLLLSGALIRRQTLKEPIQMRTLRRTTTATAVTETTLQFDQQSQLGEDSLPSYSRSVQSLPPISPHENEILQSSMRRLSLPQQNVVEIHPEGVSDNIVLSHPEPTITVTEPKYSHTSETVTMEATTSNDTTSSVQLANNQPIVPNRVQVISDPYNPDLPPQVIDWQNPPNYSEYIETQPSNGDEERRRQMRAYLSRLFQSSSGSDPPVQPANPVIELRRQSNWYIKRTSFSGNPQISKLSRLEKIAHTGTLLFFQFTLYFMATIVEQQIFYQAIDYFNNRLFNSEEKGLVVLTIARLAGLPILLLYRRSRYLLFIQFLYIAFFGWKMYSAIDQNMETDAFTVTVVTIMGVGSLIPTIQQQTQKTIEAALPDWEMVIIAIGIDLGRRFYAEIVVKEVKNFGEANFAVLLLTAIILLLTIIIRKNVIRRHAVAGTHLR